MTHTYLLHHYQNHWQCLKSFGQDQLEEGEHAITLRGVLLEIGLQCTNCAYWSSPVWVTCPTAAAPLSHAWPTHTWEEESIDCRNKLSYLVCVCVFACVHVCVTPTLVGSSRKGWWVRWSTLLQTPAQEEQWQMQTLTLQVNKDWRTSLSWWNRDGY